MGYCHTHALTQDSDTELVLCSLIHHTRIHSLELDDDLSGLSCQITQIPVAIKVGNQPIMKQDKETGRKVNNNLNLHPGCG